MGARRELGVRDNILLLHTLMSGLISVGYTSLSYHKLVWTEPKDLTLTSFGFQYE